MHCLGLLKVINHNGLIAVVKKISIMEIPFLDMIFSGIAYVMLVYFMIKVLHRRIPPPKDDNGGGGISIDAVPPLDLPPGVVPPGSPVTYKKEHEPKEVSY